MITFQHELMVSMVMNDADRLIQSILVWFQAAVFGLLGPVSHVSQIGFESWDCAFAKQDPPEQLTSSKRHPQRYTVEILTCAGEKESDMYCRRNLTLEDKNSLQRAWQMVVCYEMP